MYLDYFGLKQKPFLITPDPAFLYPSQGHQQALAHLRYGLTREGGFLLLTGEVGTGKTTLCRLLMDELPADFRLAYILNAKLDSAGVLAGICRELDISVDNPKDVNGLVSAIYDDLLQVHSQNRHTLVVIEEAQNLSGDVLETLRLLTNLETSSTKLLHILLIGQPELLETLAEPRLRQLNQRVVSRCHLGPLTRDELHHYIPHRVSYAGSARPLFTAGAIDVIHRRTGGIPRLVNLLAEHCLMGVYGENREKVTASIVRRGARELSDTLASQTRDRPKRGSALTIALLVVLLAAGVWLSLSLQDKPVRVQQTVAENIATQEAGSPEAAPAVPEETEITSASETAYPSAWETLFHQWGVSPAASADPCHDLAQEGLRCETLALNSAGQLDGINRPLVVNLADGAEAWQQFAVVAIEGDMITVANSEGERQLSENQFLERLTGDATLVWRPPEGFSDPLSPGESNALLVDFLVSELTESGYLEDSLVTGGVYGDYLVQLVQAFQRDRGLDDDGIVGINTLLEMASSGGPRLRPLSPGQEE